MVSTEKQCVFLFIILCGVLLFLPHENAFSLASAQTDTHISTVDIKNTTPEVLSSSKGKYEYLEITESCVSYSGGHCIPAYLGPGVEYEKAYEIQSGMVFKIKSTENVDGQVWYRVYFDEWLRYPDRVEGDWYIPAVAGRVFTDNGEQVLSSSSPRTQKRIVVDLSDHTLYAYDGGKLFLRAKVATGVNSTPTPLGTFTIYKKTPTRYMQGPLPGVTDIPFDLPGVPWNLYFTEDGAVIHGAYWHDRYGTGQSKGCINLPPEIAKILYEWAPLGASVTIQN